MICHICIEVAQSDEATDGLLCPRHLSQVRQVLLDLDHWYRHVSDPSFLRSTRDRDTEAWVGSNAPCDTTVLCALDRRSRAFVPGDPISPERVLRAWAYAILDHRFPASIWTHDHPMPRQTMTGLVALHLACLDWTVQQSSVVRYARHLAACRRQLTRSIPGF